MLSLGKLDEILSHPHRDRFESDFLPQYLAVQRWYGGKSRTLRATRIVKAWVHSGGPQAATAAGTASVFPWLWLMIKADYAQGPDEYYQLAFVFKPNSEGAWSLAGQTGDFADALQEPSFIADWVKRLNKQPPVFVLLESGDRIEGETRPGLLEGITAPTASAITNAALATISANDSDDLAATIKPIKADQSNTAALVGNSLFIKFYRRLEAGVSPEAEMVRYLGESGFTGTPAWRGEIRLRPAGGEPIALALITDQVAAPVNAWEALQTSLTEGEAEAGLDMLADLGAITARMHLGLAKGKTPAFLPEPFADGEPARLADAIAAEVEAALILLRENLAGLQEPERALAQELLDRKADLLAPLQKLRAAQARKLGYKMRSHGDFHLGQVLVHGGGVAVLDFEGEPARPLSERRGKVSPLRDVAGMLRSLHYASVAARLLQQPSAATKTPDAQSLSDWHAKAHDVFLNAYLGAAQSGGETGDTAAAAQASFAVLPDEEHFKILLDALLLEKAAYELRYEAQNRPDWAAIPLNGLAALLRA